VNLFFLLLVFTIAPAIVWMWIFYRQDKIEPEPPHLVWRMFWLGAISVIPAVALSWVLSQILAFMGTGLLFVVPKNQWIDATAMVVSAMYGAVLVAPIAEELVKFSFLKRFAYPLEEFDEPMDGIVYGAAIGLGFAFVENIFYYLGYGFENLFLVRSALTMPAHALFCSFYGFALGIAKMEPGWDSRKFVFKAVCSSIFFHFAFNLTALYNYLGAFALLLIVISMWKRVSANIMEAHHYSPHAKPESPVLESASTHDGP